ncbi:unnamed protein product [Rotaria magnacalcarata]|uniref:Uncharacterized protein n=1 Tax=Rotaria magnacalcarata TaxID=392030 RepID=A0A820BN80_9BILA|nr:unnamed protein product [Rotaria magnacalcarata]CAF4209038.1 unnamed protein product [Rotaria magnacalcarata]
MKKLVESSSKKSCTSLSYSLHYILVVPRYREKPDKESLSDDDDQKETTSIKNKPENNGDLSPQQYYINLFLRKIDNHMKTTPKRATKECIHIEVRTDQKPTMPCLNEDRFCIVRFWLNLDFKTQKLP